jgi:hypothetical protein
MAVAGVARHGGLERARGTWVAWRPSLALAGGALLATRLVVWAAGMLSAGILGLSSRAPAFDPDSLTRGFGGFGDLLVAPAARWDSVWYLDIAGHGYRQGVSAAFFPLYPLAARVVGFCFGSSLVGGLVVSLAASIVALAALHRLALIELGDRAARATVALIACFPAALFLSAVYSESLFLALSVGAVLAARTDRWGWAGVLGGLAAMTRSAGVVLLVPLVLLWGSTSPRRPRDAVWLVLVPAGLGLFCLHLKARGLDGLAPFHAQEVWFRHFAGPFAGAWDGAVAAFDGGRQLLSGARFPIYFTKAGGDPYLAAAHNLELFAALLAAVPALIGAFRRLPLAYGAYALAALALPLSWPVMPQPLMSLPRFELVLFPLFMWLGWWAARGRHRLLVLGSVFLGLQALATAEFATWHWFA